jgi:membrane-bound serine protease (ClpP class)
MLRPGGTARIGERRVDVVTRGEFLEPGTPLVVVEIEGNRVVVARQGA